MMEVLEHVKTPDLAIKELFRTLKPDAPLILSTPFIFPIHDAPHDYYRYTRYGLAHLLQDFDDVVIRERNDYISALYVVCARSIMADNRKNRWVGVLLFAYMLLNYPVLWGLSKFYKNPQGTTGYFVTARKPK